MNSEETPEQNNTLSGPLLSIRVWNLRQETERHQREIAVSLGELLSDDETGNHRPWTELASRREAVFNIAERVQRTRCKILSDLENPLLEAARANLSALRTTVNEMLGTLVAGSNKLAAAWINQGTLRVREAVEAACAGSTWDRGKEFTRLAKAVTYCASLTAYELAEFQQAAAQGWHPGYSLGVYSALIKGDRDPRHGRTANEAYELLNCENIEEHKARLAETFGADLHEQSQAADAITWLAGYMATVGPMLCQQAKYTYPSEPEASQLWKAFVKGHERSHEDALAYGDAPLTNIPTLANTGASEGGPVDPALSYA